MTAKRRIPYNQRFNIPVPRAEAERRFLARVNDLIFWLFFAKREDERVRALLAAAFELGDRFDVKRGFSDYVNGEFHRCLQVIEAIYVSVESTDSAKRQARLYPGQWSDYLAPELTKEINKILEQSEMDLGVKWEEGIFVPTGAGLLDEELVNEPLRWLKEARYKNVYDPFAKGLRMLLKAKKDPELLSSIPAEMYKALEALAKIVTGGDRTLDGNAEKFITKIGVSEEYKPILKDYLKYAHEASRHAPNVTRNVPTLDLREVESFVYLTGLFIRLAISRKT